MSKVRMSILATLAAIAFGLCGASSVSATPANGAAVGQIAPASSIQKVWYYRHDNYYYQRPYYHSYRTYHYRRNYHRPYYHSYRRYYGSYRRW